jgi:hypothetical protein
LNVREYDMKLGIGTLLIMLCSISGLAQTTRPTTQPATDTGSLKSLSGDQVLDQMLKPATNPTRMLEPVADRPTRDVSSAGGAVKPDAPSVNLRREGTYIMDSTARLTHTKDGRAELTFESDAKAMKDPPMIILPNQTLMRMEDAVIAATKDLKFRVTGMVTEYRGRNYILLERAAAIPDITQQF